MTICVILALVAAEPAGQVVVALKQDQPAPFTGLLVPETRFVELLEAEQWARELEIRVDTLERTSVAIEDIYHRKLENSAVVPWYDAPSFNRWLGIACGAAFVGLAVWAAAEIHATTR